MPPNLFVYVTSCALQKLVSMCAVTGKKLTGPNIGYL